jgi:hypothetical protein
MRRQNGYSIPTEANTEANYGQDWNIDAHLAGSIKHIGNQFMSLIRDCF